MKKSKRREIRHDHYTVSLLTDHLGYGRYLEDVGKAIGQSGDVGIDGIIKEDRLGLDAIISLKNEAGD